MFELIPYILTLIGVIILFFRLDIDSDFWLTKFVAGCFAIGFGSIFIFWVLTLFI